jgi:plastocyanin
VVAGVVIQRVTLTLGISLAAAAFGGAISAAAPTMRNVSIVDDSLSPASYSPNPVGAIPGDTVLWTNNGSANHTVTSVTGDSESFNSLTMTPTTTFSRVFTIAGTHHYYCTIHNPSQSSTGMYGTVIVQVLPTTQSAVSTSQYTLANSNGTTWQDMDATKLSLTETPAVNRSTLLTANSDLWTANAGFNQDIGIFVNDNNTGDQLVAWKESGGFAGTFSPNAAFVQYVYPETATHTYVFKLKWKTNKPASGATIAAGAGSSPNFSPTSLTSEGLPTVPNFAVSTSQYTLPNSDGVTWQDIDATNLKTTLNPGANSTAVLGANADLWTANVGFNQDIGIFVNDNNTGDQLVAWKESGGFAGTFSPNAAAVKATFPMTGGHQYVFKLKWKTNKNASGATIADGAGSSPTFSPTSLLAQTVAAGSDPFSAVTTSQYTLSNSDGVTWTPIDSALNVTVTPLGSTSSTNLSANTDLWTGNAGYNQDIGIFVSDIRTFTDGATTNGSSAIASPALAQFTAADIGRSITGAGIPPSTTITAVASTTAATISQAATATASGVSMTITASDALVAWKESGGFAGTFSPNAAAVQATYPMASGHTYVFKLKWKANKNASGATIAAGAGSSPTFSPTRLLAELTN